MLPDIYQEFHTEAFATEFFFFFFLGTSVAFLWCMEATVGVIIYFKALDKLFIHKRLS